MTDGDLQLVASKRELRSRAAAVRDEINPLRRGEWSSLVCRHALEWLEETGVKSLMVYVPFRSELDTRPLIEWCWANERKVILPRVHADTGELSLHRVESWNELAQGAYGIPEPAETSPAIGEEAGPLVVFVPGLAFDARGGRLGYGRGYYDRLWARFRVSASGTPENTVWIGLAYGAQVLPEVPMDVHDAYMDMLITEEGMLNCRKKGD
ncbi:5-formyltetrahydrofolate cyclo-ligase [Paenibacillus sophorae]|uniref:5-formyltetrahydrofolate cyclo-ligase n=1 Tax=Paenibacillus sophorae TaxID=1333845 RepID=A0A1H8VKQ0_9BACL|nr:5-formyltetrahydrofolate cyclo-ligase [Paenibacillus sophorae]QWU17198.1 5-formyltetrahydrofolate cyclo-ligase [Paenibacillus sophorae]SEP15913.1 5-formyltetrahydrofolate cyclo-ligase [Paenibacillus sophorae]